MGFGMAVASAGPEPYAKNLHPVTQLLQAGCSS